MSPQEREALRDWTGEAHRSIQSGLRMGVLSAVDLERVALIDQALRRAPLPHDVVLTRRAGIEEFGLAHPRELGNVVGRVFRRPGYLSTSCTRHPPRVRRVHPVYARVWAPAGLPALYLEPITLHPGQHEVLLPRGLQFIIEAIRYPEGDGPLEAVMRIVSDT